MKNNDYAAAGGCVPDLIARSLAPSIAPRLRPGPAMARGPAPTDGRNAPSACGLGKRRCPWLAIALLWLTCGGAAAAQDAPPAQSPVVRIGHADGLTVRAADDSYGASLHFATWIRSVLDAPPSGQAMQHFDVPLVRPLLAADALRGHIRLLAQPELAGPRPRLLDLQLDYRPASWFSLRLGQFRTPYSRAYVTPIVQLAMPDRGPVSDHFRADRDTGLMAFGTVLDQLEYQLGVFNGAAVNDRAGDARRPMVIGRLVWTAYGNVPYDQSPTAAGTNTHGLSLGLAALSRERAPLDADGNPVRTRTRGGSAELSLVEGPLSFFAEGFLHRDSLPGSNRRSAGAFAQAGFFVLPHTLELSARGSVIDADMGADDTALQSLEGGIKAYLSAEGQHFGHHGSLGLQYRYVHSDVDFDSFAAGVSQRLMAQLQLWI